MKAGIVRSGIFCTIITMLLYAVSVRAETYVDDPIESNTVWTAAGSPYILNVWEDCDVGTPDQSITLTIEAGVEVVFRNTDTLYIETNATLIVNGTDADPVTFRLHSTEGRGDMRLGFNGNGTIRGAVFDGTDDDFNMCEVWDSLALVLFRDCEFRNASQYALNVQNGCRVKVENCVFHDNGNDYDRPAILMDRPAGPPSENYVNNCRFYNHPDPTTAAIEVIMYSDESMMPGLSGNTGDNDTFVMFNAVNVEKEFISMSLAVPGTLDNGEVMPYVIHGALKWDAADGEAVRWEIEAGNTIEMYGRAYLNGVSLHVNGTADRPVHFTKSDRWDDGPASWAFIEIDPNGFSVASELRHAVFEYGGDGARGVVVYENDEPTAGLEISHCEFRDNYECGLFIEQAFSETGGVVVVEDSVFHDNADTDIRIRSGTLLHPVIDISDCRFYNAADAETAAIRCQPTRALLSNLSGDNGTFIQVEDPLDGHDTDARLSFPGQLDNGAPIPYVLRERWWFGPDEDAAGGVKLNIDPGCVVDSSTPSGNWSPHITIQSNAAFVARGAAEQPIVFTTSERYGEGQDYWSGIRIEQGALGVECAVSYCSFEGGDPSLEVTTDPVAINHCMFLGGDHDALAIGTGGGASVASCVFRDYAGDGLWVGGTGYYDEPVPVSVTGCIFTNNNIGAHFGYPDEGTKLAECSFFENSEYGVKNERAISIDARGCNWGDNSGPLDDSDDEDTNYDLGYMYHNPAGAGDRVSDNVIYAPWIGLAQTVTLTIRASDCALGGTWPLPGEHEVELGSRVTIAAVPICGAEFFGWTVVSGEVLIAESTDQITTATPLGDCIIEANLYEEPGTAEFRTAYNAWAVSNNIPKQPDGSYDPARDSDGNGVQDIMAFARGTSPVEDEVPAVGVDYTDDEFIIVFNVATTALPVVAFAPEGTETLTNSFEDVVDWSLDPPSNMGPVDEMTMRVRDSEKRFFRLKMSY